MQIIVIIFLPLIAGLIGWITNYLAVKMLFHPREPKKILGVTFHGVFPKRQAQVALKVGQLVANELLNAEDIFKKLNTERTIAGISSSLELKLDKYFDVTLPKKYPMVARFLPKKAKEKIKAEVLNEVETFAPEMIQHQISEIENTLDIESIITDKVNKLSSRKLEEVIWNILSTEFRFIEWVGAILGFTIGLIQVIITFIFL